MNKRDNRNSGVQQDTVFDKYPWAANHNDAISWLTSYMDGNIESIIKQFDDRILQKVAKDHLVLTDGFSFS